MSHFYGSLQGSRGPATRCGSRASGIRASARSWTGSVTVDLDDVDGVTYATIRATPGSAQGGRQLWRGPVADLLEPGATFALMGASRPLGFPV
jgi:hypothetical protein